MSESSIFELMETGCPVAVRFIQDTAPARPDKLFCELVQCARHGDRVTFSEQGCPAGAYIFGRNTSLPDDYYHSSGRYKDRPSAEEAARSLPRLMNDSRSIRLSPLKKSISEYSIEYDVLLLFVAPIRAMKLIQALSYHNGLPITFRTGGTASVCGDCTAACENTHQLCISFGCKGSRKHSRYGDNEVIVGIPRNLVAPIQVGLAAIPGVFD